MIEAELKKSAIDRVNAVLVGHAHHDHALDATWIADRFGATVVGSESFAQIYHGSTLPGSRSKLVVIPCIGKTLKIGRFTIYFAPSDHVGSHAFLQRAVEGEIREPLVLPAHFSKFKCGDVFALHIAHPEGGVAVTTTAGAKRGQFRGRQADVIFLGVGLLSKESRERQEFYWQETVEATGARLIVPVHWDNFARKLSRGLKPSIFTGNTRKTMEFVKAMADGRTVRILDVREAVSLVQGEVHFQPDTHTSVP